jgi:hypothetical protein
MRALRQGAAAPIWTETLVPHSPAAIDALHRPRRPVSDPIHANHLLNQIIPRLIARANTPLASLHVRTCLPIRYGSQPSIADMRARKSFRFDTWRWELRRHEKGLGPGLMWNHVIVQCSSHADKSQAGGGGRDRSLTRFPYARTIIWPPCDKRNSSQYLPAGYMDGRWWYHRYPPLVSRNLSGATNFHSII